MDKEQAKFMLQSFRPDGADAEDPAFEKALSFIASDRELGEWLAKERAQDAAFAQALSEIKIPEDLRETIFKVLAEGETQQNLGFDSDFISALASTQPPEGLRDQILNAMEIEKNMIRPAHKSWGWRKLSSVTAAAAAITLAVFLMFSNGGNAIANTSIHHVHSSAISMLSSPLFKLDLKDSKQSEIYEWLDSENFPTPDALPQGLQDLDGVGCKYLSIGEQEANGSLICYRLDDDTTVHLIVMDKDEIKENIGGLSEASQICEQHSESNWATTQWADDEQIFFLLSKTDPSLLASLF